MSALRWSIKSSLIAYVRGMPDGRCELDEVTEADGAFLFPSAPGTDDGSLRFRGGVTFIGHNGMMHVAIADPWITRDGAGAILSIADPDAPARRMPFARIAAFDGCRGSGTALTGDGADLFFGPYTDGTPLDDLRITP